MHRHLTALTLGLAMFLSSLTTTARPAQADDDLLGKLLLGAVAAGIAYQLLRDQDPTTQTTTATTSLPAAVARSTRSLAAVERSPRPKPRGLAVPVRQAAIQLPTWTSDEKRSACRQVLPTRRGDVGFISDRCLNHPRADARVPQTCLRDRWVQGGWRQVYSRKCLERHGEVL